MLSLRSPGVFRQEVFLVPESQWQTGVPVFIGYAIPILTRAVVERQPLKPGRAVCLHHKDDFLVHFQAVPGSFLADAVQGFFANGGLRCYVLAAAQGIDDGSALSQALEATACLDDVDLLAVPDLMSLRAEDGSLQRSAILRLQTASVAQATRHRQFALLDALPGSAVDTVVAQLRSIKSGLMEPMNAALYFPWLRTDSDRLVPPCGHVAGVIARTDDNAGVFKAPANAEIFGVVDLDSTVDSSVQDHLNSAGVNCCRSFASRGIRLWGARTINLDPSYRYVHTRRLVLAIARAVEERLMAAVFEPNAPRLWVQVQRELDTYLGELWLAGALQGDNPDEAYYIKCDQQVNPPEARERGEIVAEIGIAPNVPAEFIVLRVVRRAGSLETAGVE